MIIKSHIRGGHRQAAKYLKDRGENEKTRLVEINDPNAGNLDEAFTNMWATASRSRARKPLHHISINPYKDERLTDEQVMKIVECCEQKYGYRSGDHQRVIVEHIKDGRQHFHVMWNRISLKSGKAVWPGHHWNKSRQAAREMEVGLGLKRPMPRKVKRLMASLARAGRTSRYFGRYKAIGKSISPRPAPMARKAKPPPAPLKRSGKSRRNQNVPDSEKNPFRRPDMSRGELLAWAWDNARADILASFGIHVDFEP